MFVVIQHCLYVVNFLRFQRFLLFKKTNPSPPDTRYPRTPTPSSSRHTPASLSVVQARRLLLLVTARTP